MQAAFLRKTGFTLSFCGLLLVARGQADTTDVQTLLQLGNRYASQDNAVALKYLQQAYNRTRQQPPSSHYAEAVRLYAFQLLMSGQLQEARRLAREALGRAPADTLGLRLKGISHFMLGIIAYQENNLPEAIKQYEQAAGPMRTLRKHENLGVIYNNIGLIYYRQKQFEHARRQFQQALALVEDCLLYTSPSPRD